MYFSIGIEPSIKQGWKGGWGWVGDIRVVNIFLLSIFSFGCAGEIGRQGVEMPISFKIWIIMQEAARRGMSPKVAMQRGRPTPVCFERG